MLMGLDTDGGMGRVCDALTFRWVRACGDEGAGG